MKKFIWNLIKTIVLGYRMCIVIFKYQLLESYNQLDFTTFIFFINLNDDEQLDMSNLESIHNWVGFDENIIIIDTHQELDILNKINFQSNAIFLPISVADFDFNRRQIKITQQQNCVEVFRTHRAPGLDDSYLNTSDKLNLELIARYNFGQHKLFHKLFIDMTLQSIASAIVSDEDEV